MRFTVILGFACVLASAQQQPITVIANGQNPPPPPTTIPPTFTTNAVAARVVRVSVSKQPLQVFIAVLGSKLAGVAGFSATACLAFEAQPVTFSGLVLQQMIESRGIDVISYQVAAVTAQMARRNSKQYRIASATSELGYGVSVAMPLLGVGSLAMRVAAPVVAHYAEKYKDSLNATLPDPVALYQNKFLDESDISLQPGRCSNKLFLGGFDKQMKAFAADLELR